MNTPFSYSTTYSLDKSHFSECYDESANADHSIRSYFKSAVLAIFGLSILLFTDVNPYAAWFIVALSAIEALSIRFRKSWWLARQMLSKAAKSEMTLTIDEDAVSTQSFYVESKILWSDVTQLQKTQKGWLIFHPVGKNYISSGCLSLQAEEFIANKA